MSGRLIHSTATIASSGTTSNEIKCGVNPICGVYIPAGFTGTTIGFVSATTESGTYYTVRNTDGALSYTVSASTYLQIDPSVLAGCDSIKIVAGSSQSSTTELIVSQRDIS